MSEQEKPLSRDDLVLETKCVQCDGSGHSYGPCYSCKGTGFETTYLGEEVLALVRRHLFRNQD